MRTFPLGRPDPCAHREVLAHFDANRAAVGHFNFSELSVCKAVADAASKLRLPVVLLASESEREFLDTRQAAAIVQSLRQERALEIFRNTDHTHSLEKAEAAARAGSDMILFDASEKPHPPFASLN